MLRIRKAAAKAPAIKAAMFYEMGIKVHLCGSVEFGNQW
jgi:hypothetical protein